MNDFVFRGFCHICNSPIKFDSNKNKSLHWDFIQGFEPKIDYLHELTPVWFLSAKQIIFVRESSGYKEWWMKEPLSSNCRIEDMLQRAPFLVAKILKDSEPRSPIGMGFKLQKKGGRSDLIDEY